MAVNRKIHSLALISQFLIKGFDVDFGEHGPRMACLVAKFLRSLLAIYQEMGSSLNNLL